MTENICGANSTCQNYDGGFNCTCDAGFEMIDGSCLGKTNVFYSLLQNKAIGNLSAEVRNGPAIARNNNCRPQLKG